MFPPLAYLDWIEGRPTEAAHDLGSSDLRRAPSDAAVDPVPDRLAGLSAPTDGATLDEAVAREYDVDPSSVLLTAGATHANFVAAATAHALAVERRGDADDTSPSPRALVETPGYEPLVETPRALGTRIERFRRPLPTVDLDSKRAADALDSGRDLPLSHLTVTNRHNPTGHLASRDDLAAVADVAAAHDGYLLVDEVYAPYTAADGGPAFGGPTAAGLPATVVTGSLTKFHGLGGLRVGWLVGPERFVDRARDVANHVPALARPSVALARRFFANRDPLVAAAREHCAANHDLLAGFLADRDDLSGVVADGSPFGYLEHERADGDAVSEAAWDDGVLVVPGRFFGVSDGVRVSLGRDPEHCEAALAAFGRVLDDL